MHRIEQNDKQQGLSMAWHGLTEIVENLSLENCCLAMWDIIARILTLPDGTPTRFAILGATDDPSITIGVPFDPTTYRPISNAEFLQLLKDSTEGIDGCKLVSIGSVRNRGRVFASFQTQELAAYKAGGRTFKPYLNFGNGHDKSSVLWANTSNTDTVCDNTFSFNLAQVVRDVCDSFTARHTKGIALRLPEIGELIRNANILQTNFAMAFEKMSETIIDATTAERLFAGFVVNNDEAETLSTRARNIVARLLDLFHGGRGNKGQTLGDLFSAVTEYYTHENAGNTNNPWKQLNSAMFGNGQQRKADAFRLLQRDDEREALVALGARLLQDK